MTSIVKRSVPPPTLVKVGNPLVRMLLGSPLHGMLDDSFLVLHLTGRKTGRRYEIPVGYRGPGRKARRRHRRPVAGQPARRG